MGLTSLRIEIANPANPKITEQLDFLIDSGAIYSVVPSRILRKLGIKPISQQEFRLADGSRILREKGVAIFKYEDRIGGADVIFGKSGDHTLLGRVHSGSVRSGPGSPTEGIAAAADDIGSRVGE